MAEINKATDYISALLPAELKKPSIGIICGSGMSGLGELFTASVTVNYSHIPGFPRATVMGHQNVLKIGKLEGHTCIMFLGRFHEYEGIPLQQITLPVRIMAKLGVSSLVITNSAGTINPDICEVGDFVAITDHISFPCMGQSNPLIGTNLGEFGGRFASMHKCYHPKTHELLLNSAVAAGLPESAIKKGVYCHVVGPSFETAAEVKLFSAIGGAAIGMSSIPEVIVASHCKQIKNIIMVSLITDDPLQNFASKCATTHEEVLSTVQHRSKDFRSLIANLIPRIAQL